MNGRTRNRVFLIVFVAFLPAIGIFLFAKSHQRDAAIQEYGESLLRSVHVSAVEYERFIEEGRGILASLAEFPEVRQGGVQCSQRLATILPHLPQYTTLSLIGLDGYLICGSLSPSGSLYLGDRAYFRKAVTSSRFSVGSYAVGRITGKPTVGMAHPIVADGGLGVESVLAVALDLNVLGNAASRMNLHSGATFTVLDEEGRVMVRVPEGTGPEASDTVGAQAPEAFRELLGSPIRDNLARGTDLDGVDRMLAVRPLRGLGTGMNGYLVIGGDEEEAMATIEEAAQAELLFLLISAVAVMLLVGILMPKASEA